MKKKRDSTSDVKYGSIFLPNSVLTPPSVTPDEWFGGSSIIMEATEAALDYLQNPTKKHSTLLEAAFEELRNDSIYSELSALDLAAIILGKAVPQKEK